MEEKLIGIVLDKIVLKTDFGKKIVANVITKAIKKNLDIDAKLVIDKLEMTHPDGEDFELETSARIKISSDQITKLIKSI